MGCDSWTSDSDEEPAAATVAVTATPGQVVLVAEEDTVGWGCRARSVLN